MVTVGSFTVNDKSAIKRSTETGFRFFFQLTSNNISKKLTFSLYMLLYFLCKSQTYLGHCQRYLMDHSLRVDNIV